MSGSGSRSWRLRWCRLIWALEEWWARHITQREVFRALDALRAELQRTPGTAERVRKTVVSGTEERGTSARCPD